MARGYTGVVQVAVAQMNTDSSLQDSTFSIETMYVATVSLLAISYLSQSIEERTSVETLTVSSTYCCGLLLASYSLTMTVHAATTSPVDKMMTYIAMTTGWTLACV